MHHGTGLEIEHPEHPSTGRFENTYRAIALNGLWMPYMYVKFQCIESDVMISVFSIQAGDAASQESSRSVVGPE